MKFYILLTFFILIYFKAHADTIKLIKDRGVYKIPTTINNSINLDFIIDTGASEVVIPWDLFTVLLKSNTITKKDIITMKEYQIGTGEIVKNLVINIKNLTIGNITLHNVRTSVSPYTTTPLLLGQSALEKLGSWKLDTINKTFIIKPKHSKNIQNKVGYIQNQKYVCIYTANKIKNKLVPLLTEEDAMQYPLRIKIDSHNILHTDGKPNLHLKYLGKEKDILIYGNSKVQINLGVSNNLRILFLMTSESQVYYTCVETNNWSLLQ